MGRVENIRGMIGILNYCMKNIYTCVKICIMYCIRLMIKDSDNSSSNHHKSTSAIIVLIIMISDKLMLTYACIYTQISSDVFVYCTYPPKQPGARPGGTFARGSSTSLFAKLG